MKLKTGDWIAIAYVVLYAAVVFFFPLDYGVKPAKDILDGTMKEVFSGKTAMGIFWNFSFVESFTKLTGLNNFGHVVSAFPYLTGFFKVALLATFGEMLKVRGRTGSWKTPQLLPKFIIWGIFGLLFSLVFALFAKGVEGISGTALWFGPKPFIYGTAGWGDRILMGFSISLWCNLIFCYPMMLAHEWCNTCVTKKKFVGGAEFLSGLDPKIWGSFMLKSIVVFWIPAHTVTFSLPPDYRVLMSAVLSLALGFILTIKPKNA